jgi:cytochrome c-type biogenesis protein CcmH/NrfG
LRDNFVTEAIAVLRLNTEEHADSFNAFDSLAEAWVRQGDLPEAIRCYERAVKLNPNHQSGREMIERLRRQLPGAKAGGSS